ncbi:molybdopterin synthase catalytic subunit [Bemisia tabaci]|uniref:molybdopterin synthase catalytic subunit n=1 Tax=Bemisia tabaci TaxID=7038 RepID=UPI0008F9BE96|nr:PREDICTED: uncharacterized protein LOC109044046 [Bemisia tabaci]
MEHLEFVEEKLSGNILYKRLNSTLSESKYAVATFLDCPAASYEGILFCINEKVVSKIFAKLCGILKAKWHDITSINVYFRKGFVTEEDGSFAVLIAAQSSLTSQSAVQFLVNNFKSSELAWKQKADFLMDFNSETVFFDCEFDSSVESLFPEEPEVVKAQESIEDDVPSNLVQIQAPKEEVTRRISQFLDGKRDLMNKHNESFFALVNSQNCSRVNPVRIRQHSIIGRNNKLLSRCMDESK